MPKPKILLLSDSPTTCTGYATITRKVLNGLSNDFECHILGHNYFGQTIKPGITFVDNEKINCFLHGAGKGKYSMDMITYLIRKYNIDVFGILLDSFMAFEAGFMNIDTSPAKTFFYFPSDGGGGLPIGCEAILKKINVPIAMAKFGQKQAKKVYGLNSLYIPHGVDTKNFFPMKSLDEIKQRWQLMDNFVVGTVARNQGRKMLDRTLKAFKLFCVDKPETRLLLHTDPDDGAQALSLKHLVDRYQLNNRVIFTGTSFYNPFTYKQMNEIYNLMDIFLLSTSGEGFGVPIIEAMACGVPQVVTDYTTTQELVIEDIRTGEAVKLSGDEISPAVHTDEILNGTITGSWNVERAIMSISDCVLKLNKLYYDKNLLKQYSVNSLKKVKNFYSWNKIIPQWKKVLLDMIK